MADRDDSIFSTPVILAATFGAAAVLIGIVYTLKGETVETKGVPKQASVGESVAIPRKHKKAAAKEKVQQASAAVQSRGSESSSVEAAEGTVSKRKKGNVTSAEVPAAAAVNKSASKGVPKIAKTVGPPSGAKTAEFKAGAPPAAETPLGSTAAPTSTKQQQFPKDAESKAATPREVPTTRGSADVPTPPTHQPARQHQQPSGEDKPSEKRRESGDCENGGDAEAAAGGQSKTVRRKQRKKKKKAASDSPASSSGIGTPQLPVAAVAVGDSVTPPSAADAAAIAAALSSSTAGEDTPPEDDDFTIVSKKASRKKINASPGNSTQSLASESASTYSSGRFTLLADDSFAR